MRKRSVTNLSTAEQLALSGFDGEANHLLSALFGSSTVGVAICDRQLRFRAINDALASMNGIPAAAHLGKTIHAVLGSAAAKVQPAFEHVFATGQPLSNFEVTAELPSRGIEGHWNESYFPIKDHAGQVQQVGAVVLELTGRKELDVALFRLTDKLARINSTLRDHPRGLEAPGLGIARAGAGDVFTRSVGLVESCLSEARAISQLLHAAPKLIAAQPLHPQQRSYTAPFDNPGLNFASMHAIDEDLEIVKPLSLREREVVALLAAGKTNKEIATILVISTRTVETHRARIMLKLDMHSLSELVRYAVRSHLIQP